PLYAFIFWIIDLFFQWYAKCPFAGAQIRFNIFTKIPDSCIWPWHRDAVAVRAKKNIIRFAAFYKIKLILYTIENFPHGAFVCYPILEFYFAFCLHLIRKTKSSAL